MSIVLACLGVSLASPVAEGVYDAGSESWDAAWIEGSELDVDARVVGGSPASPGQWPSTVGIVIGGQVGCTGTLISPSHVITAAHCVDAGTISHVRVGTVSRSSGGSLVPVVARVKHPSYDANNYSGADLAVLTLQTATTQPASVIATDCVAANRLYDGAPAAVAGFGAINQAGNQYVDTMHQGPITIQDATCAQDQINGTWTSCDPGERPGGELFAGGSGVDACFGDSGGPIYVEEGGVWYVAGVTSRGGYQPGGPDCGIGGVWVRPDAYLAWIEGITGALPRPTCGAPAPAPTPQDVQDPQDPPGPIDAPPVVPTGEGIPPVAEAGVLVAPRGGAGSVRIEVDDPDSELLRFAIASPAAFGHVEIDEDGVATYVSTTRAPGVDAFDVRVVDESGNEDRVTVYVRFVGGGCSTAPGAAWGGLALLGGLLTRRRRR